jgi:hypothetical protein
MQDQTEIFIFASPEIQELLADNQLDLVELLKQEGIEVGKGFAKDPTASGDSTQKDPTGIILASAALILAITPLISKVLTALSRRSIVIRELVCVPVEDSNGNVVRDRSGEPLLQWVERSRLLEQSEQLQSATQISLKGPVGLEVSYSDSPKANLPGKD